MKVIQIIIGGFILIALFAGFFMSSVKAARTTEYEQTNPTVATAAGVTTANVTLIKELWEDDIVNVSRITSTNGNDIPAVFSYNSVTGVLTVQGLEENSTRALATTYLYAALTGDNAPADTFFKYMVLLVAIAIFVVLGVLIWNHVHR